MSADDRLLQRFFDRDLDRDGLAALESRLAADPEARRTFYEVLMLEESLRGEFHHTDYFEIHSRALRGSGTERTRARRHGMYSLAAAAALVAALLVGAFFLHQRPEYRGEIWTSADAELRVAGSATRREIRAGDTMTLDRGVASLDLTDSVHVLMEGPTELHVLDHAGTVEVRRGNPFFEVTGGHGLRVRTPGGTLRDIGTSFGVRVAERRQEVHVVSGAVEILREGGVVGTIREGGAAAFGSGGVSGVTLDADAFLSERPPEKILLSDDFEDEDGTRMSDRRTAQGVPWFGLERSGSFRRDEIQENVPPLEIRDGVLDTTGGPRILWAPLEEIPTGDPVYLLSLDTVAPRAAAKGDNEMTTSGAERIAFTTGQQPSLGLGGRGTGSGHFWFIEKGDEAVPVKPSAIPVTAEEHLTLRYDSRTGVAEMLRGRGEERTVVARRRVEPGLRFDGLIIMNHETWGDLALEEFTAKAVVYPKSGATAPAGSDRGSSR